MASSDVRTTQLTRTYEQFLSSARLFLDYSTTLRDGWELREAWSGSNHVVHYLAKKCTVLTAKRPSRDQDSDLEVISDDEDEVAYTNTAEPESVPLSCEYHVIYDPAYQVPVLYFTASYPTGKLVPLGELWSLLPAGRLTSETGRWDMLTDKEHPLLGRPFYHIHPCHTSKTMATVLLSSDNHMSQSGCHENYILTWLSMFGPVIGMELSLEYGKLLLDSDKASKVSES